MAFEVIFLFALALVWIIFATVQDLKTKEIANWLNFSLIIFALGFRFFYSLFIEDFTFFYQGVIGLGIFFVLGNLLYYGRFFAGGDAKLMIALGAILPLTNYFSFNLRIFVFFLGIFLIVGGVYSLSVSLYLGIRHYKELKKEFKIQLIKNRSLVILSLIFGIVLVLFSFSDSLFFPLGIFLVGFPYIYIYTKAVDEACMKESVPVGQLVEGDWLYKDIVVGGKKISARWAGLDAGEISLIRKNRDRVFIRQGVPFTPVFLISFLIFLGAWFFDLLSYWILMF